MAPDAGAQRSLSIAFVAALQRLPPDQRAALVLSDVLEFPSPRWPTSWTATSAGWPPAAARQGGDQHAGPACANAGQEEERRRLLRWRLRARRHRRHRRAADSGRVAADAPAADRLPGRAAARHFLSVVAFPGGTPATASSGRRPGRTASPPSAATCGIRPPRSTTRAVSSCSRSTTPAASPRSTGSPTTTLPRFGLPRTLRPPRNYVVFSTAMFYNFRASCYWPTKSIRRRTW